MSLTDSLSLRGRVALVTGGSRGIGRAVSLRLAEAGAQVALSYAQDESAARLVAGAIEEGGAQALALRADVSSMVEANSLIQATVEHFGRLDILVCSAGVWEGAAVAEMSEELWQRAIDVNLKGTWTMCRAVVPQMKRQGFGRIVVVSSTAGQRGEANFSNYAAAKGGQISFTKSLATELAPYGITANAVAPGWVETEMTAHVFADAERRRAIEEAIPLGRIAAPDDVALPILFLCSAWARHITGEVLNINGGTVLCG